MRSATSLLLSLLFATTAAATSSADFADLPADHWAAQAIRRVTDAGILRGFDGRFHGEKLINRYQMAVILERVLGQASGPPAPAGEELAQLSELMSGMVGELQGLSLRTGKLDGMAAGLRAEIDALRSIHRGHPTSPEDLARARRRRERMGY